LTKSPKRPDALVGLCLMLFAVRVGALAWSPIPSDGMAWIALLAEFCVALTLFQRLAVDMNADLSPVLRFFWPFVAFEAALVILFRVQPAIEDAYLHSRLVELAVGPNSINALLDGRPNNVFDVDKAGGLFVNANIAAMFLGVSGLAAIAAAARTRSRLTLTIGVGSLIAVCFAGSKSATLLVGALPAFGTAVICLVRVKRRVRAALAVALLSCVALIWGLLTQASLALLADSETSLDGRAVIWGYGARVFPDDPVLGQGYGGWESLFPTYANSHGIGGFLPPHNLLLNTWTKTGSIGVLITLIVLGTVLRIAYRAIRSSVDLGEFRFSVFAGCACLWLVIQSMGENTDFFGEVHFVPIVAALLAQLGVIAGRKEFDGVSPQGSSLQAPTLHALRTVHS
jgi:hypothetical protein